MDMNSPEGDPLRIAGVKMTDVWGKQRHTSPYFGRIADSAGYRIVKIREPVSQRMGLLFTVSLPEIKQGERPRRRFMSAFEQKREIPNRAFQYFVVSTDSSDRVVDPLLELEALPLRYIIAEMYRADIC